MPQNHHADDRECGSCPSARIRTVACLGGISLERGIPSEQIGEYIRDATNLIWIDLQDPGPAELSLLLEEFGFHPLALEDVAKGQQRPKVDEYRGYMFVVTYAVVAADSPADLRTAEVDLFIGRNYVVTIHRGIVPALDDAYGRWTRGGAMLSEGVGFLVYTIMDSIIDAYFPLIDRIEDEVDETETAMFAGLRTEGVQSLLKLKRTLVTLRRLLNPLREIFNVFLRRDQPMFSSNTIVYFQDVHDHILRILDVLDIERDMVTGALEAYLTVISNRLNMSMKTLSVITVVVAIGGLTFGAWGMNFEHIPMSHDPLGFWAVVLGTVGLISTVLLIGWKRSII
jgi:magnesium transporter